MATLTNQQIEQKKQLLAEKMKEMKAIYNELAEAGAIEISVRKRTSKTWLAVYLVYFLDRFLIYLDKTFICKSRADQSDGT